MVKNFLHRTPAKTTRSFLGFLRFVRKHPFLILFSIFIAVEIFVLLLRPDITLVARNTHILDEDLQVHQSKTNSPLLYGLAPGTTHTYNTVHPKENLFTQRTVTVNNLGLRDTKLRHNTKKSPDTFTILIVGSSNTYGMLVDDPYTYPAQLEKLLQKKYPGKFQVLNAGIDAYSLMQKTLWAQLLNKQLVPDLIIFQLGGYWGRQTFLINSPKEKYLRADKQLLCENVPFLLSPAYNNSSMHNFLTRSLGSYRFALVLANHLLLMHATTPEGGNRLDNLSPKHSFTNYFEDMCGNIATEFAVKKLRKFIQSLNIPLVFFEPVPDIHTRKLIGRFPQIPVMKLNVKRLPEQYSQIHPPSYGYTYYAQQLLEWLEKQKLLQIKQS